MQCCVKKEEKPGHAQTSNDPTRELSKAEKIREKNYKIVVDQLDYAKVQEILYDHLSSTIDQALDDETALNLLMEEFGQGPIQERPAHAALLREGFENLIHHKVIDPSLMIDILTLMNDRGEKEPTSLMQSNEFTFALRVLAANWHSIHRTTRDGLLKLIWKRLCNKDNWSEINNTRDISDATLEEFLLSTNVGWTFQGLMKLIGKFVRITHVKAQANTHADHDEHNRVVWPKQLTALIGAGGTHGELCVRFPLEDLREPIIKDNLLDDEILQENLEKNRLDQWFKAACRAGKNAYFAEKRGLRRGSSAQAESGKEGIAPEAESSEVEGDTGDGAGRDQDVEMQES